MVTPTLPRPPAPTVAEVCYPESDGQPVAETDVHRQLMFALIGMLQAFFRDDPHVYISGNLFVYYQEGDPRQVVAPDVFVVPGVRNHQRRIYKLWEEGVPPAVVFELTSRSTRREDLRSKYDLYERLGVREYFLFDPLGEYLRPACRGYRLHQDRYRPLSPAADGSLWSAVLRLALHARGEQLRLYDPAGQRWLPTPQEEAMARRAAEERAGVEAVARQAAEERASVEAAARQAAEERVGVEAAARQAAEERASVEAGARRVAESQITAAEAELARLRALLSSRGQSPRRFRSRRLLPGSSFRLSPESSTTRCPRSPRRRPFPEWSRPFRDELYPLSIARRWRGGDGFSISLLPRSTSGKIGYNPQSVMCWRSGAQSAPRFAYSSPS